MADAAVQRHAPCREFDTPQPFHCHAAEFHASIDAAPIDAAMPAMPAAML